MKNLFFSVVTLLLLSCADKSSTQANVKVWGNCEMCKETIEGSLKLEGIEEANWNTETKVLSVKYDSLKVTLDQIEKFIAGAGYDNEKYAADSAAYASLPECCQYERK